jgi:hypothetical protein
MIPVGPAGIRQRWHHCAQQKQQQHRYDDEWREGGTIGEHFVGCYSISFWERFLKYLTEDLD